MPDEPKETRELFSVNVQYVVVVKDLDGHYLRIEPGGSDQLMWPWGRNLDDRIAAKIKELEQG